MPPSAAPEPLPKAYAQAIKERRKSGRYEAFLAMCCTNNTRIANADSGNQLITKWNFERPDQ